MDFFRVDLDGKNHTLVYTTSSANLTTYKFTVWADSTDNIYIVVHEVDDKLIKTINVKTKKVKTLDEDVDEVIVVNGPGSFTGIRIGVTIAKIFAYLW